MTWWREGVLYQIYPRSWRDANGDGVGDLEGVLERLDYLAWLGVDGIWLNPTFPSPDADWGYDVADYLAVHPQLGTTEQLERLVAEAGRRGIRVLLDLVPNHTSIAHPWFRERPDYYVWSERPNNWLSAFGGSAWTLDAARGRYYLHSFLPEQPDLDWWNEDVRREFDGILRHWFDRGVAGFRIDVAHRIVKDQRLRDNLPVTPDDHPHLQQLGQRQTYTANQPEVHEVFRRWRRIADAYDPPRLLLGETYVLDPRELAAFYGAGDELDLALNFYFLHEPFEAAALRRAVEATEAALPADAWPVWHGSNHDVSRFPTRWCAGDDARVRLALLLLLTLRGTALLYYGDEIGMRDVDVPAERQLDRVGRDRCRTPMQWDASAGAGFTSVPERAWLPIGRDPAHTVEAQRGDPGSPLELCRAAIALRRRSADLRRGAYVAAPAPEGAWAFRRGERTLVALNLSSGEVEVEAPAGRVALATAREREGERGRRVIRLGPWSGVVLEADERA